MASSDHRSFEYKYILDDVMRVPTITITTFSTFRYRWRFHNENKKKGENFLDNRLFFSFFYYENSISIVIILIIIKIWMYFPCWTSKSASRWTLQQIIEIESNFFSLFLNRISSSVSPIGLCCFLILHKSVANLKQRKKSQNMFLWFIMRHSRGQIIKSKF